MLVFQRLSLYLAIAKFDTLLKINRNSCSVDIKLFFILPYQLYRLIERNEWAAKLRPGNEILDLCTLTYFEDCDFLKPHYTSHIMKLCQFFSVLQ